MKLSFQHTHGFTLIEFLLYMAISVTMVLLIGSIGIGVLKSNLKGQAQEEIRYDAEFLLQRVRATVRDAESVDAPSLGTASSSITLIMEDASKDPTRIHLREGSVYLQEGTGTEYRIAGEDTLVTALTFTNMSYPDGGNTVRIELSIDGKSTDIQGSVNPSSDYYTTVHIPYSL